MTQDIAGGRRGVAKRPLAARAVGLVVNAPLLAILDELPLPVVALVGESLPVGTRARLANQIRHLFVVQLGPGVEGGSSNAPRGICWSPRGRSLRPRRSVQKRY